MHESVDLINVAFERNLPQKQRYIHIYIYSNAFAMIMQLVIIRMDQL